MTRSLDEPVTMPDYGFLLAILEMKIDRIIADQRKLIQILEVREDVES